MRVLTALFVFSLFTAVSHAETKPSSLFGNGMVLQREMPVPVWGSASPGETVTVTFAGQSKSVITGQDGKWMVKLDPLEAAVKGRSLTIISNNTITIEDVLVGEVWVCSGQSNMGMNFKNVPELKALLPDVEKCPIRHYLVKKVCPEKPQENCKGQWSTSPPSSAVAFGFGYHLQKQLNVPVGIIQSSVGGTYIGSWMPATLTQSLPEFAKKVELSREMNLVKNQALWMKETMSERELVSLQTQPTYLYNGMLHPIIPYAVRGFIWYQGEANAGEPAYYGRALPLWVKYLREQWKQEKLHFMVVMLPRLGAIKRGGPGGVEHPAARSWAWFREIQMSVLELPNTSVANTIDLGDLKDIHPTDKEPICKRLMLLAMRDVHGKKIVAEGPRFNGITINGSSVRVSFEHAEGLKTTDGAAPSQFWLAGKDKNWVRATGRIDGATVILEADGLTEPVAVRYAFAAFPEVNLINGAGLPAYPFRSDDWE